MGGGVCKVIFMSNPTIVSRLGWGFDNFGQEAVFTLGQLSSLTVFLPGQLLSGKLSFWVDI